MVEDSNPATAEGTTARNGETAPSYLNAGSGVGSWLLTFDHKRISILYLMVMFAAFVVGTFCAFLLRLELLAPSQLFLTPESFDAYFALHGAIMIFLFVVPSIPASLGNFFLPMMIGAENVAFPRLNLATFYLFVAVAVFGVAAMLSMDGQAAWNIFAPQGTAIASNMIGICIAAIILGLSSTLTSINFLATIHLRRARGMSLRRLPVFVWSLYGVSLVQVLSVMVIGAAMILAVLEHLAGWAVFNSLVSDAPVVYRQVFWFYAHPAVFVMIVPAIGIVTEIIATFSRKTVFGHHTVIAAAMGIACVGLISWANHVFVGDLSAFGAFASSFLLLVIAVPGTMLLFNLVVMLLGGSISLQTPMLYAISFLFLLAITGIAGVFLGAPALNGHLGESSFASAQLHYLTAGSIMTALIAGLHYWWPKITGRMYSEWWGKLVFMHLFLGINLAFFPQLLLGARGMPRRYYTYIDVFQPLQALSTVGSWLATLSLMMMLVYLVWSLVAGRRAVGNPWGGLTQEWASASPPCVRNFAGPLQVVSGPYDYPGEE